MPPESPETAAPDIVGAIDVVKGTRIAGWAADRSAPGRRLEVEIRRDGALLATVPAERPREDLARAGVGDGRHGFELLLEEPLAPGEGGQVEAFALGGLDGAPAALANRTVPRPPAAARPQEPPGWLAELSDLCRSIEGYARRLELAGQERPDRDADAAEWRRLAADLAGRLESLEALQPRLDALAARLDTKLDPAIRRPGRGLAWAVAVLGCLSAVSLGVGVASYLR